MIGDWTYRFKSRFVCDESDSPVEVHQATQIVPPRSMNLKPIDLPLNKDLGEAGCVFQSAVVLCNLLTDRDHALYQYMNSEKKVVEVGSGTGVLGLASAAVGARVCMTDLPHVLDQLRGNFQLYCSNNPLGDELRMRCSVEQLTWGCESDAARIGKADLILCSDCLYREETHRSLLDTLKALSADHTLTVLSFEIRRPPIEAHFIEQTRESFEVEQFFQKGDDDHHIQLYYLRPK
uniref:Calmodulin-lysine N-methyltransferase n=1 Tax=Hanusia phi TaxID=3032 RepID=A0A7S0HW23_9CRYP